MTDIWPELNRDYQGLIGQACTQCKWHKEDLHRELECCPDCNNRLEGNIDLRFGGLIIEYKAISNKFIVSVPYSSHSTVVLDNADMPEVILFLLRHWKPWDSQSKNLYKKLGLPVSEK